MKCLRTLTCLFVSIFAVHTAAFAGLEDAFGEPELLLQGTAEGILTNFVAPTPRGAIFFVYDPTRGFPLAYGLWTTDGTPEGTVLLQPELFNIGFFKSKGLVDHFRAQDGADRFAWWRTDGTAEGTFELAGNVELYRAMGYDAQRQLFFALANDTATPFNLEPWVSDGTVAGTRRLKALNPGVGESAKIVPFENKWYFLGPDPDDSSLGVWETDGTPAGTRFVVDDAGALWSTDSSLYLLRLEAGRLNIYRSNGTEASTIAIHELGTESSSSPSGYRSVRFFGDLGSGRVLWVHERRPPLSGLAVSVTNGEPGQGAVILELERLFGTPKRLGDAFYFLATGQGRGLEFWRSDGTIAGTGIAVERCPGPCSGFAPIPPTQVTGDRLLLFSSVDPATGQEPLVSDGTPEGTFGLGDVCPGPCSSSIADDFRVTNLGGVVIFTARVQEPGFTTHLVATDLSEGSAVRSLEFAQSTSPVFSRGTMFFLAREAGTSQMDLGLWKLTLPAFDPIPPPGPWSSDPALPGFEAKVRISFGGVSRNGLLEAECISETLCFSGALPGRTEVFVRVVGPKPNGRLWPTLTKFTTSTVEVWLRQFSTDEVKYYQLEASPAGIDELTGLFDREGFAP